MSYPNQELTIHRAYHWKINPNCEYCAEQEQTILRNWYLKHWISYKEYLRLTGLLF